MSFNISTLFFELALILIPGFIWMKIHSLYGAKGKQTNFDQVLNAFIFGVLSYVFLYVMFKQFGRELALAKLDTDPKKLIQLEIFPDVLWASLIAVIGGVASLYFDNYKIFTRFVQRIGATKTYGDEDVWDFVFNSPSRAVRFIHFRDFDNRVVYAGIVESFSETGELRELVLQDVAVYDFNGTEMYRVPRLYIARGREKIYIEFPIDN